MDWRVKAILQKGMSTVPGGTLIHEWLQRWVGDLSHFDAHVGVRFRDWEILIADLKQLNVNASGLEVCEIGTGWVPVLPICLWLSGVQRCVTFDIVRHLKPRFTIRMVGILESYLERLARDAERPLEEVKARYAELKQAHSGRDVLERACIDYKAPADASSTGLPDGVVDIVFSNNVLQYIPAKMILELMNESKRLLRSGGIAIHRVNCFDEYRNFDSSITAINYVTYSQKKWEFWNTPFIYQNRLRPTDFLRLAERAGLEVVFCRYKPRQELLEALPRLRLAPEFRAYSPEEICSTHIDFAVRKR